MNGTIVYGGDTISYEVLRRPSRQTLTIEVHPDGRVLVRAPKDCPDTLISERVQKRAAWIGKELAAFERYQPRTPPRQYINGESHLYLGRQYRLRLADADSARVKLTRGVLLVSLPGRPDPQRVRALVRRWYLDRAHVVFEHVLDAMLARFGGGVRPTLRVRAMKTRWGSLSSAGTMTLNVDLVRAPRTCIEYVVVHELCHLRYRNHDADFYRLLDEILPAWRGQKERLESALL